MSEGILVIDSSTLIALERSYLFDRLNKIDYNLIIPASVKKETGEICEELSNLDIKNLSGNTLKISRDLQKIGIGSGEADCVALAKNLKLKFIICDDRKLIRQIFFSKNKILTDPKILGFSFLLNEFFKTKLISDIWENFDRVIKNNNWERSIVQISNYTFLKKLGY